MPTLLRGGSLILPDRVVEEGALLVVGGGADFKIADLLVLDEGLRVERVFLQGREIHD